ncbi:hypothetical protein [Hyphomicrobium sp. 2TAF46]|uniref:hypothetical protein n=1 Tax=Hyphomicrobium sp. 2TAF46 TaxID=3233019 RepID=UPI003F9165BC
MARKAERLRLEIYDSRTGVLSLTKISGRARVCAATEFLRHRAQAFDSAHQFEGQPEGFYLGEETWFALDAFMRDFDKKQNEG